MASGTVIHPPAGIRVRPELAFSGAGPWQSCADPLSCPFPANACRGQGVVTNGGGFPDVFSFLAPH